MSRRSILAACAAAVMCALWLSGCSAEERAQEEAREQAQRTWESENVSLDFYIWSDEETYVRQVVDAYNGLKAEGKRGCQPSCDP